MSTSPGHHQLGRSPESFSMSDMGSFNIAEDMFDQLLTTAGSSYSLSQMSDDTTSILSQGSQTSDIQPLPEAVQHLRRSAPRPSSAPSSHAHKTQIAVPDGSSSGEVQPTHPRQHSADTTLLRSISPSSTHESLSIASDDYHLSPPTSPTPQVMIGDVAYLDDPPMTPPTPHIGADGSIEEQLDFTPTSPTSENSRIGRKVRLASSRRGTVSTSGLGAFVHATVAISFVYQPVLLTFWSIRICIADYPQYFFTLHVCV